jgi:hypothetical protein
MALPTERPNRAAAYHARAALGLRSGQAPSRVGFGFSLAVDALSVRAAAYAQDRESETFSEVREWQDQRLEPGYFTGGQIHPMYRSRRAKPWGWPLTRQPLGVVGARVASA